MKLIKYDKGRDSTSTTIINAGGSGGGDTSSRGESGLTTSLNRTIWGQNDIGDDVDGTMVVNGDIHIKTIVNNPSDTTEEEGEDGEWEGVEEGGGSLYVEQNAEINKDAYIKQHLYINYPLHTDAKQCVVDLIKKNADNIDKNKTNISNNTTEINSLKTRVSNAETNITNNATNISNNTTEINKLKSSSLTEDRVKELIKELTPSVYGDYSNPVVLYSGRIRRSSVANSNVYFIEGNHKNCFSMSVSIDGGLMTISITPNNCDVNVGSVCVTQYRSGDTGDNVTATVSIKARSDGAHWFEARQDRTTNTTKVYIREFHQGNGDNDTWYSDNWFADGGIKEINVIMTGYVSFPAL